MAQPSRTQFKNEAMNRYTTDRVTPITAYMGTSPMCNRKYNDLLREERELEVSALSKYVPNSFTAKIATIVAVANTHRIHIRKYTIRMSNSICIGSGRCENMRVILAVINNEVNE